jgi:hypothetical protein
MKITQDIRTALVVACEAMGGKSALARQARVHIGEPGKWITGKIKTISDEVWEGRLERLLAPYMGLAGEASGQVATVAVYSLAGERIGEIPLPIPGAVLAVYIDRPVAPPLYIQPPSLAIFGAKTTKLEPHQVIASEQLALSRWRTQGPATAPYYPLLGVLRLMVEHPEKIFRK